MSGRKGFTTVELLIVVAIVAIISVIVVSALMKSSKTRNATVVEGIKPVALLVNWSDLHNGVSVIEDRKNGMLVYVVANGSHPGGIVVVPLPAERSGGR